MPKYLLSMTAKHTWAFKPQQSNGHGQDEARPGRERQAHRQADRSQDEVRLAAEGREHQKRDRWPRHGGGATGAVYRAIVPAGYKGQKNENWYVRLFPPPFPGRKEHVAFTTPYSVVHSDFGEWLAYFRRTLPITAGFADY